MSLLATFLEGVYKTSTSGLVPPSPQNTGVSVHLAPSRAEDILKSIDDPELEAYLTTSIEIQQIQILEQDAIFKMVDEFCNSYTEALKQGPTAEGSQGDGLNGSGDLEQPEGVRHLTEKDEVGEGSEQPNNKKRRGNLPKASTNILKKWLYDHLYHPYPTEEEKKMLESRTGMTLNQISNWFINARRRILQPMLESVRQQNLQTTQSVVSVQGHGPSGGAPMAGMGSNLVSGMISGPNPPILHTSNSSQQGIDPNMMMHHTQVHPSSYRPMRG